MKGDWLQYYFAALTPIIAQLTVVCLGYMSGLAMRFDTDDESASP